MKNISFKIENKELAIINGINCTTFNIPITEEINGSQEILFLFDKPLDFTGAGSIRLSLSSEAESLHAFELSFLSGRDGFFTIPEIRCDWKGCTFIQLDTEFFKPFGSDGSWEVIKGIGIKSIRSGYTVNTVELKSLVLYRGKMEFDINEEETVIDHSYLSVISQMKLWRTKGSISGKQSNFVGALWTLDSCPDGGTIEITRDMDTSVEGFMALEVYHSTTSGTEWRVKAVVDGRLHCGDWKTGTGKAVCDIFSLPENSLQLSEIALEFICKQGIYGGKSESMLLYTISKVKRSKPWKDKAVKIPDCFLDTSCISAENRLESTTFFSAADLGRLRYDAKNGKLQSLYLECRKRVESINPDDIKNFSGSLLPYIWFGHLVFPGVIYKLSLNQSLLDLAHVYLVEENIEYARLLIRLLAGICSVHKWAWRQMEEAPDGFRMNLPFSKEISIQVSYAFDAVKHIMSPQQKGYVLDALLKKGVYPTHDFIRRNPYVFGMNQGVVFSNSISLATIPLLEELPEIGWIVEDAEDWYLSTLNNYILDDGSCSEGVAYWIYTIREAGRLLGILAKRDTEYLLRKMPCGLLNAMKFAYCMLSNSILDKKGNLCLNAVAINDCRKAPPIEINSFAAPMARFFKDPLALEWIKDALPTLETSCFWPESGNSAGTNLPLAIRFNDSGIIMMRSGYQFGDFLLLQQNGLSFEGKGHTHYDRGALLIECFGELHGLDSGTCSYEDPLTIRMQDTDLHSHTVTVNGEKRQFFSPDGNKSSGVLQYLHSPMVDFSASDLGPCYPVLLEYSREVFYFRPHMIVCIDRLSSDEAFGISYNVSSEGRNAYENGKILSRASFSSMSTSFITPLWDKAEYSEWPTNSRAVNNHLELSSPAVKETSHRIIAVHEALMDGARESEIVYGQAGDIIEIHKGSKTIYLIIKPGKKEINGIEVNSDGRYSYIILEDGSISGFGIVDGTYINLETLRQGQYFSIKACAEFTGFIDIQKNGLVFVPVSKDSNDITVTIPSQFIQKDRAYEFSNINGRIQVLNCRFSVGKTEKGLSFVQIELNTGKSLPNPVWFLLGKDINLNINRTDPYIEELRIDEKVFTSGTRIPYGSTFEKIEAVFCSDETPFIKDSFNVLVDGRDITESVDAVWSKDGGKLKIAVEKSLLESMMNKKAYSHGLSISAANSWVEYRPVHAYIQFYSTGASFKKSLFVDLEPDIEAGSLNKYCMPDGYPVKVNDVEYLQAMHCSLEEKPSDAYFRAVYDLGAHSGYKYFTGYWAVDDSASVDDIPGKAAIELLTADGQWITAYESPVLKRYSKPTAFSLHLSDATVFRLVCSGGMSIVLLDPDLS